MASDLENLVKRIVKLPSSGDKYQLDSTLLQKLKESCKNCCDSARSLSVFLLADAEIRCAVVRIRSLRVIEVLFERSRVFRSTICDNLRTIAQAGFLIDSGNEASATSKKYKFQRSEILQLQHLVKSMLEVWDLRFGSFYPVLHAFARYIRESLRLDIPDVNIQTSINARNSLVREEKSIRVMIQKVEAARKMLENNSSYIRSVISSLGRCCELLEHHCNNLLKQGQNVVLMHAIDSSIFPITWDGPLREVIRANPDVSFQPMNAAGNKRLLSEAFTGFQIAEFLPSKRIPSVSVKHELRIVPRVSGTASIQFNGAENVEDKCDTIDSGDEDDIAWANESNGVTEQIKSSQIEGADACMRTGFGIDESAIKEFDFGAIFSATLEMAGYLETYTGPLLSNFQSDLSDAVALFRDKSEMSRCHSIAAAGVREIASMSLAIHKLTKIEVPKISVKYRSLIG